MPTATEYLQDWLNGTVNGGPNGDGRYPLMAKDGTIFLVYCPAAQAANPAYQTQPVEVFSETASTAAANAAGYATSAEESASDAFDYMDAAGVSATNAASSASTAQTAKTNAESSANSAAASATQAASYDTTYQGYVSTAAGHESSAEGYKDAAAVSAANALTSESNADISESNAASSASSAAGSATTATTKASEASSSASSAAGSASAAATSASNASTSEVNASSSASSAATSASNASTSEVNAASSASSAAGSVTTATTKASEASSSASTATTKASEATTARDKAFAWAETPYNTQVESGEYSAKHWAEQAEINASAISSTPVFTELTVTGTLDSQVKIYTDAAGEVVLDTFLDSDSATKSVLNLNKYGGAVKINGQTAWHGGNLPSPIKQLTSSPHVRYATEDGNTPDNARDEHGFNYIGSLGPTITFGGTFGGSAYPGQITVDYLTGALSYRARNGDAGVWSSWRTPWDNLNFNPNSKASLGAAVSFQDITATRGNATGVLYLGNQSGGPRYLHFDGANYVMPSANLWVNGYPVVTTAGAAFTGTVTLPYMVNRSSGAVGTQQVFRSMQWNNGVQRWAEVIESDASYALYSYDGTASNATAGFRIGTTVAGGSNFARFPGWVYGSNFRSEGSGNTIDIQDRINGSTVYDWKMYSNNRMWFLWDSATGGNKFWVDASGNTYASAGIYEANNKRVYSPAWRPELDTTAFNIGDGDFNNAGQNGWWMGANMANAPGGGQGWWMVKVDVHNSSWITQEAYDFTLNIADRTTWRRAKINGTWQAWTTMERYGELQGGSLYATYIGCSGWILGSQLQASDWFRSTVSGTGWYHQVHGGGWYMNDNDYIKNYNQKGLCLQMGTVDAQRHLRIEGTAPTITFYDTDANLTSWIHSNSGHHGFLSNNAFAWAAYRDSANNWVCNGDIIAFASDGRLKKNVVPVDMNRVNEFFRDVQIKIYDWDAEALQKNGITIEPKKHQVGAIAQHMQRVLPDAVEINKSFNPIKTKDNPNPEQPDFLTIKWDKTVPYLIAKVQDQDREIAELKKLVNQLMEKM